MELYHKVKQLFEDGAPYDEILAAQDELDAFRNQKHSPAPKQERLGTFCANLGKAVDSYLLGACGTCGSREPVKHRVYTCEVFKRCVPTLEVWGSDHEHEAGIYHLCNGCERRVKPMMDIKSHADPPLWT